MSSNTVLTIIGGILLVALIAVVGAMAFQGTISGTDALGFLGGMFTLASGIIAHSLGVASGAKAAKQ